VCGCKKIPQDLIQEIPALLKKKQKAPSGMGDLTYHESEGVEAGEND